jgi:hypothetical protein
LIKLLACNHKIWAPAQLEATAMLSSSPQAPVSLLHARDLVHQLGRAAVAWFIVVEAPFLTTPAVAYQHLVALSLSMRPTTNGCSETINNYL